MSVSAIFLFILILLVLVIVHEFGHFIVAKWTGMRVDEFAFGFPPKLFGKKIGETTYAFNALPLGGYVSIWGENGSEEDKKENGAATHPRAFGNRPWWAQLLVLVAGVTMNMLLALFIFIFISYASMAGVAPGAIILKVTNGSKTANLTTATSLVQFIGANPNTPFTITFKSQDGQEKTATIAAVYGIVPDKKALGISLETVGKVDTTLLDAISLGYNRTVDITIMTVEGLVGVVSSAFKGSSVLESLSGPIGIAKIVGETSEYGYAAVLTLVAVLSINLAIFNILPLPALDGGRIVVVLIETISRRKIPFKYYSWVNVVGFLALMLLLIVVTINDVRA